MSKRNRRQFLEDSMFAAAAAAVTANSTVDLVASDAVYPRSANQRLSVAVVGARGRGGSHIGAFAGRGDTEVTYVCDVDGDVGRKRVAEVGKRQRGRRPRYVADLRRVLDDPSVDVVTIATPNHWHALAAIWAMQAGKDVYVEKPVSHNVSEGRRMVQAARKYGRICQAGMQCRSNSGIQDAMRFLHDGKIGHVKVARALCYTRRSPVESSGRAEPPASVDYGLWLGPAELAPVTRDRFHYDWHWFWSYGNGDLGNQGVHQVDIARWGLGANRLSDRVFAYGGRYGAADAGQTADTQVVVHDYVDRRLVFESRALRTRGWRGARVGVVFEGTDGFLVVNRHSGAAAFDADGERVAVFSGGGNHFDDFLRAVRGRRHRNMGADIEQGHLSSALCHLGNICYRLGEETSWRDAPGEIGARAADDDDAEWTLARMTRHLAENGIDTNRQTIRVGQALSFDPDTETFRGSERADRMLTRAYRPPFVVPDEARV